MSRSYLFLTAGLVFAWFSITDAARPPDYLKDLNRWMGRDHQYYVQRWDPQAERYTQFENEMRSRIEKFYRDKDISRREFRSLRDQLTAFDDQLRNALDDGKLSWTEKRLLETREQELKGNIQETLLNREYYPYREPHDYEALNKTERDQVKN